MPQYLATKVGFYDGKLYGPDKKRRILTVEKPFKKCPSWLTPVPVVKEVLDFTGDEKVEGGEDTRSPQQKAADTRKANKSKAAVQL